MSSPKTSVEILARRVLVSGKVQGVGYRYALAEQARNAHIQGWCRNLPDGRVEAWLQGSREAMSNLLEWLYQGPPEAEVAHVHIEEQALLEPLLGESIQLFEIRK